MTRAEVGAPDTEGGGPFASRRGAISRAGLFQASNLWLNRLVVGLRLVHQGIWLGVSDRDALHDMTERHYASSGEYADPGYNTAGLRAWELLVIDRFFGTCRSVLVGAAGAGREVIVLARRGIQVDAFECCPALVEASRGVLARESVAARIGQAAPDEVPENLGTYDGAILGWGGYTHVQGRAARVRLLRELRGHVRPGGPLMLSCIPRRAGPSAEHAYRLLLAIARGLRRLRRSREPIELGDTLPDAFVHRFSREEIRQELEATGFRLAYYAEEEYGVAVGMAVDAAARTLQPREAGQ